MPETSYVSEYEFSNKHIDTTIERDSFLTSARAIIYAAPGGSTQSNLFHRVGVIQGYNWAEQRQIEMIFELGSDTPYLIPGRTTGQLALTRILLFGRDLVNVVYYGDEKPEPSKFIKSIKEITKPLNFMFSAYDNDTQQNVYSRVFANCWIQSRNENIAAGQVLVAESVSLLYEDVIGVTIV